MALFLGKKLIKKAVFLDSLGWIKKKLYYIPTKLSNNEMGFCPFFFGVNKKMLNKRADKLELLRIAEAVALEKSIDKELIISSMETGIAKAAKSKFGQDNEIKVLINRSSGDIEIFRKLVISIMWNQYIKDFSKYNTFYLEKILNLSVFSHENAPSFSGNLPKWPYAAVFS